MFWCVVPEWPKYGTGGVTMQIGTNASDGSYTKVIMDDFREEQISFLESRAWTSEVNI